MMAHQVVICANAPPLLLAQEGQRESMGHSILAEVLREEVWESELGTKVGGVQLQ